MGYADDGGLCLVADIEPEIRDLHTHYLIVYGELDDGHTRSPLCDAPTWCVEMSMLTLQARARRRAREADEKKQREIIEGLSNE